MYKSWMHLILDSVFDVSMPKKLENVGYLAYAAATF